MCLILVVGRHSNRSVFEAIGICEDLTGNKLQYSYAKENRIGGHKWYIADIVKFITAYSGWRYTYDLRKIWEELYIAQKSRLSSNQKCRSHSFMTL